MFASKTPRDLNHDPKPHLLVDWVDESGVHYYRSGRVDLSTWPVVHDPRPEFDHVQHNEPNPILVAFREDKDNGPAGYVIESGTKRHPFGRRPSRIEHWLLQLDGAEFDPVLTRIGLGVSATSAHVIHARKVLQRLVALS